MNDSQPPSHPSARASPVPSLSKPLVESSPCDKSDRVINDGTLEDTFPVCHLADFPYAVDNMQFKGVEAALSLRNPTDANVLVAIASGTLQRVLRELAMSELMYYQAL